ncbi:MAG: GvpL/GvpF family gas vesicle protein [bacterium]
MAAKGIYIYGIVPNFYGTTQFQLLENSGVYAITFENISAIVSDRDGTVLDYSDRESLGHLLVHHQETIEQLQGKGFNMLLPMRLGTIAASKEAVIRILSNGHQLVIDALTKIEYLTEIDIAVTWADFSETLKYVANHPDIIELKETLLNTVDHLSQIDQVKVGMLIQEKLDEKNKHVELKILDALSALCVDIKMHDVMNDEMITNSAFLLNRNKKEKFELAIDKLDEDFKGSLNFKLVGPLPCYSFFTLEVRELDPEQIANAKKELGMREHTTEAEIKKAYFEKAKLFHPDNSLNSDDTENFNRIKKAYHTLLDYAMAAKQSSNDETISLVKERVIENLILVKIKE